MLALKSKILLFPYWIILKFRHFLYDKGILKSTSYPIPVICVGNITVGGTGKTPHTEMIIRMLQEKYRIAVLSRGYKRKSKGFRIAGPGDTFAEIGDEPMQIKHKFPHITVAVCADRREGIEKLLALPEGSAAGAAGSAAGRAGAAGAVGAGSAGKFAAGGAAAPCRPELIILDDAFQHRRVKPSHSIVLMNWNNPIYSDNLLPIGRLRDLPEQIRRADSIIVTKSPRFGEHDGIIDDELAAEQLVPVEKEWRRKLHLRVDQKLCFSTIMYGTPAGVEGAEADNRYLYSKSAIFFTGIANDREFRDHIAGSYEIQSSIKFPDHYSFTKYNIKDINNWAALHPTAVVFTTEKDCMRLTGNPYLSPGLKKRLFYIPIEVKILGCQNFPYFASEPQREAT
ncbi:MAG: tetraacyldisaccharide 4'-kinase [Bacteroidales bacterium]|nr:tetraacyldisaccharide 4'-kinase [Bacteroidales bacterium]